MKQIRSVNWFFFLLFSFFYEPVYSISLLRLCSKLHTSRANETRYTGVSQYCITTWGFVLRSSQVRMIRLLLRDSLVVTQRSQEGGHFVTVTPFLLLKTLINKSIRILNKFNHTKKFSRTTSVIC